MNIVPKIFKKPADAITETLLETGKVIKKQTVTGLDKNFSQMLVGGPDSYRTPQQIEQMKMMDKMKQEAFYKRRLQELDKLKNNSSDKNISELQKDHQKAVSSFQELNRNLKSEVNQIGKPQTNSQTQQQKKAQEEQEEKQKKQEKAARLSQTIEVQGKTAGGNFKRKSTPTRMKPPKSLENKSGSGIGG